MEVIRSLRIGLLAISFWTACISDTCHCADLTAEAVQKSIDRGVGFLRKSQNDDGSWQESNMTRGGLSPLCALALLNCGYDHTDPTVSRALRFLRTAELNSTYAISLQTMVFCQARQPQDLRTVRQNVRWLEATQRKEGAGKPGSWTYGKRENQQRGGDPSNTQFALLALSAAEERGVEVSSEVFKRAEAYWAVRQRRDGSWSYIAQDDPSGSMTCAGIASLVITRSRTAGGQGRIEGEEVRCCGGDLNERDRIGDALKWLGNNFMITANPGIGRHVLYYLYALERVGRLTGQRLIGGHDWYREGASYLLEQQNDFDGSWIGGLGEDVKEIGTSLALLFLSKGKRRVVVSRLEHGKDSDWNWHPDALRQLTRHVEKRWKQDLTWQTVRLSGARLEDLLQTPVLFISGSEALTFSDDQKQLLKQYVQQGGFIFAQATAGAGCQDARAFENSLGQLMEELFGMPLEKLPATHPIWNAEHLLKPDRFPSPRFWLYGVQACCRTSVIYSPISLACMWEVSDPTGRNKLPAKWEPSVTTGVHIGENVIAYATGRRLSDKLAKIQVIDPDADQQAAERGTLIVPRLPLGAGGDEASRALPNLMEWMRRQVGARISSQALDVGFDKEALQAYPIVFMHGRNGFTFTQQQRDTLRAFLADGGSIIASSICGSKDFTQAFRREMQLVLPKSPLVPMPADHEALSSRYRGFNLSKVTLNQPSQGKAGTQVNQKVGIPLIERMQLEERDCVLFSPYDLSCALENQSSIQCTGYDTVDAAKIGINLILYAMLQ